ncbi:MAG: hypothetical protein AAGM45_07030 [Cyanobacteria bacterium J06588_5]
MSNAISRCLAISSTSQPFAIAISSSFQLGDRFTPSCLCRNLYR